MGLDPRGFMDGAFRGFQMMESYYDRQDRKQDRTDSLRRADERQRVDDDRYNAQITKQNERQQVEDQRYDDNLKRDKDRRDEEVAWRKQVHEDNKALKSLRYATSGKKSGSSNGDQGGGKEYRQQVTKLMNWKHDAIAKIDPSIEGKERELAIEAINSQYNARLTDVRSLYVTSEPTPKNGGNGGGTGTPPPNGEQSYYSAWADSPIKQKFLVAIQERGANLDDFDAESLDRMYEAALKKQSTAGNDASLIRSMKDKAVTSVSNIELPKPISLRSASEVMNQSAMHNYSNAIAGKTQPHFSAPVLNAGVVDGIEYGADLAVKTSKQIAADTAQHIREQNKKILESGGNSSANPHQTYY